MRILRRGCYGGVLCVVVNWFGSKVATGSLKYSHGGAVAVRFHTLSRMGPSRSHEVHCAPGGSCFVPQATSDDHHVCLAVALLSRHVLVVTLCSAEQHLRHHAVAVVVCDPYKPFLARLLISELAR